MRRRRRNPNPGWGWDTEPPKAGVFGADRLERQRLLDHRPRRGFLPVFDRGDFAPVNRQPRAADGASPVRLVRTRADRQPARETVTAKLMGDPPPDRAGRALDCEDSLRAERSAEAYRLLGREPPNDGYATLDLEQVRERIDRLAPRRWRPRKDAAE